MNKNLKVDSQIKKENEIIEKMSQKDLYAPIPHDINFESEPEFIVKDEEKHDPFAIKNLPDITEESDGIVSETVMQYQDQGPTGESAPDFETEHVPGAENLSAKQRKYMTGNRSDSI